VGKQRVPAGPKGPVPRRMARSWRRPHPWRQLDGAGPRPLVRSFTTLGLTFSQVETELAGALRPLAPGHPVGWTAPKDRCLIAP